MGTQIDANTGEETVIEQTYVEGFGFRVEVFGFNTSVGNGKYMLNLDLAKSDEFVKALAGVFLGQTTTDLVITEGQITMAWKDVHVDGMYGFKSFGCSTDTQPTLL